MTNKKLPLFISALVILIGVGIHFISKPHAPKTDYDLVLDIDKKNIENPKASESELYGAMIRLAQKSDPVAKKVALEKKSSASPLIREGCAVALGYFEEPTTISALMGLLGDKESKVRVRAIEALSSHWTQERQNALDGLLKSSDRSVQEKIAIYASLAKISPKPEARANALAALLKIARGGPGIVDYNANLAASELMTLAPKDQAVADMLRDIVKKGGRPEISIVALRHLAASGDVWMRTNIAQLSKSPDIQIRLAAIQSIHMSCPDDRWEILKSVLSFERESAVIQSAIVELMIMRGPQAKIIVNEISETRKFGSEDSFELKKAAAEIKNTGPNDPCLREMLGRQKT